APLDRAGPSDLSFLASGRYLAAFRASRAGVVLCTEEHRELRPGPAVRIVVPDPHQALLRVVAALNPPPPRPRGIDPTARIGRGVVLGADVFLGPGVVIGDRARLGDRVVVGAGSCIGEDVTIGDDCTLHHGVTCYARTVVGNRTILHAGVRLGVDGFGYVRAAEGHVRIPHVGRCVIGDDVEIGANTTVDRGSIDDTVIGNGTKLDNLVHVGHNVRIGARCLVMAQVGIAGSTRIEDDVILAGQVGLAGHLTVGAGARVAAQSGVIGDIEPGSTVWGTPARPQREVLRATNAMYRLAGIVHELEALVERDGTEKR
ncbi:MAG TPA: UDP-3-O-(3-hydroxymyristoyl)glucosamine N-acyltransferase, partial [Gemmatimonadales bacterium]|nr:UDP-3-O-(3-hydroxymyristoyl)glucosamine N-acyltransferase [Gemmatimonadales bacterium]